MAITINLLPEQDTKSTVRNKTVRLVTFISLGLTLVVILIAGGVYYIQSVTASNLSKVKQDIATQESILDQDVKTEQSLVGVKSQLDSISKIISKRYKYSQSLINFAKYVPQSISITDLTISADNKVIINGIAPNDVVAGFLQILSGERNTDGTENTSETPPIYTDVTLTSLSENTNDRTVRFSISFTAVEGAFNE